MDKKKLLRRFAGTVCFLAGLFLLLNVLTYVTRNKNEADIVYPYYYEEENSLDVVFVGSSHIMCGIYPMDLYHDYGIKSYDYASSALVLPQTYYQVIEALKAQSPEVLVIDVSGAIYGDIKVGSAEYVHTQLDNMKWSLNKICAIHDLIEDPEDRLLYYFPLLQFHTRWKELEDRDFRAIQGGTKGAYLNSDTNEDLWDFELVSESYTEPMSDTAETYLRKILDYCQEQDVQVLLLNTPMMVYDSYQGKCNAVASIAEEYGVPYLNLMYHLDELDFDWEADMRDIWHCNTAGAQKVTSYVGAYLKANYTLTDYSGDADWDAAYAAYKELYPY